MSTSLPTPADALRAIELARKYAESDPKTFHSMWGSCLEFEKADALRGPDGHWVVWIPESGVSPDGDSIALGLPCGLEVEVDLETGTCRVMQLE